MTHNILFLQVLGEKPELAEGDDDDDKEADVSNRKMAKLYMVEYSHSWKQISVNQCNLCLTNNETERRVTEYLFYTFGTSLT